jgi:hypothetical protein
MIEEDGSLIEAIANSEEKEIYETKVIQDVIDYKWETFGRKW